MWYSSFGQGVFRGNLGDIHGILMGYSWDIHGILMGYSWDISMGPHGILGLTPWDPTG